jgi:hypothetical protein
MIGFCLCHRNPLTRTCVHRALAGASPCYAAYHRQMVIFIKETAVTHPRAPSPRVLLIASLLTYLIFIFQTTAFVKPTVIHSRWLT